MRGAYASDVFGPDTTAIQPSPSAMPEHLGRPEPFAKTLSDNTAMADNPVAGLVVLAAVTIGLIVWSTR